MVCGDRGGGLMVFLGGKDKGGGCVGRGEWVGRGSNKVESNMEWVGEKFIGKRQQHVARRGEKKHTRETAENTCTVCLRKK